MEVELIEYSSSVSTVHLSGDSYSALKTETVHLSGDSYSALKTETVHLSGDSYSAPKIETVYLSGDSYSALKTETVHLSSDNYSALKTESRHRYKPIKKETVYVSTCLETVIDLKTETVSIKTKRKEISVFVTPQENCFNFLWQHATLSHSHSTSMHWHCGNLSTSKFMYKFFILKSDGEARKTKDNFQVNELLRYVKKF